MTPAISVIIAAYNVERYIERAIRSALAQGDAAVEVIIVDDCSADGTAEAVAAIKDSRLTYIRQERNGGPGAARNRGIAAAKGAWLAVLDGDDAFAAGRLAALVVLAGERKADVIVDNLLVRREADGASFPMFPPSAFARLPLLDLPTFIGSNRSFFAGYTYGYLKPVFSTDFVRRHQLRYDPAIKIGEDYMFMAEMLACGAACAVSPEATYEYTVRAGSISHRISAADLAGIQQSDRDFTARHDLSPAARRAQRRRNAGLRDALAFALLVEGVKGRNLLKILKSFCLNPFAVRHFREALAIRLRRLAG